MFLTKHVSKKAVAVSVWKASKPMLADQGCRFLAFWRFVSQSDVPCVSCNAISSGLLPVNNNNARWIHQRDIRPPVNVFRVSDNARVRFFVHLQPLVVVTNSSEPITFRAWNVKKSSAFHPLLKTGVPCFTHKTVVPLVFFKQLRDQKLFYIFWKLVG